MCNRFLLASLFLLVAAVATPLEAHEGVWVRCRVVTPADLQYWANVPGVGSVGAAGFVEKADKLPEGNGLLKAGDWSAWVQVPPTPREGNSYSGTEYGFTNLLIYPPAGKPMPPDLTVGLEFSAGNTPANVFHTVAAEPAQTSKQVWSEEGWGIVSFLVPKGSRPEELKSLETIHEASLRRLKLIEEMNLGAPPRLTKLHVGTWMNVAPDGRAHRDHAAVDFRIAELLGLNAMTASIDFNRGAHDADFAELAAAHGIVSTSWTTWGGKEWLAAYMKDAGVTPTPPPAPGSPPPSPAGNLAELEATWRAGNEKLYADQAATGRLAFPKSWPLFKHLNLGDEIGPPFNADSIAKDPSLLAGFRDVLSKEPGLTPALVGASSWNEVIPLDDRKRVTSPETTRLFYHTRRAIDVLSAALYRTSTGAVRKSFPQSTFVGVNYQAGPIQYAFIGNTNDLNNGMMDIFELSRRGAFHGVMTEDWAAGWDLGVGQICLGADMMRAAGRKLDLPLSSYIVGGENPGGELFAYLMQGVKENNFYLYGPYTNIGPVWADNSDSLAAVGKVTRLLKKVEEPIAAGRVRPSRAALLIATTSDVMQVKGTFFCPERQFLYLALKHNYINVDVICEQDVTEDDVLKNYDLLYVADPQIRRDVQERISAWVNAGGWMWAGPAAGRWDEYNHPSDLLNAALGVTSREITFQDPWPAKAAVPWATTHAKLEFNQLGTVKLPGGVELPAAGLKLACTPGHGAEVVGTYDDGKPAVVMNAFGKGGAMLVGFQAGQAYVTEHYAKRPGEPGFDAAAGSNSSRLLREFIDAPKLVRPAVLSVPGLYTSVWDTPGGTLLFVMNMTGATVTPQATLQLPPGASATAVESSQHGAIKFEAHPDGLRFALPVEGLDVIHVRH